MSIGPGLKQVQSYGWQDFKKGIKLWQAQVAWLQRYSTENWKNVFPESKLRGLHFYIRISVSGLYIPTIGLPIWLQSK
jgi:hypothetical protein